MNSVNLHLQLPLLLPALLRIKHEMGWIRGLAPAKLAVRDIIAPDTRTKERLVHVEDISGTSGNDIYVQRQDASKSETKYPFQPQSVSDEDLPLITSAEVVSKRRPGALSGKASHSEEGKDYWIVVDDIVYDCTFFILDHPGGEQIILSFVGENCSCMAPLVVVFSQRFTSL